MYVNHMMNRSPGDGKGGQQQTDFDPPDWITTDELENELFNAIMADSTTNCDEEYGDFDEFDDYLADDEEDESEVEKRRSTLRLLAAMRPQLAELLGGPPAV